MLNEPIVLEIWLIYESVIWLAKSIFNYPKLNIYKPSFGFLEFISVSQKSSWLMKYYLKYSWFKKSVMIAPEHF